MDVREIGLASPLGKALIGALAERHGPALAGAARVLERVFIASSPWAPGLCFIGGSAHANQVSSVVPSHQPFSLAGSGETVEDAIASCVGEAVERLSQMEQADDVSARTSLVAAAEHVSSGVLSMSSEISPISSQRDGADVDWTSAVTLSGEHTLVPTDWCVRRAAQGPLMPPGVALSTGCAAASSYLAAAARALLELIERDAVALWWIGGCRGRPLDAEDSAATEAVALLQRLRGGNEARSSWLLDITTDLKIPTVVALSVDGDQRGLACGMAARTSLGEAARSAILEMCQMELALQFIDLKQRQRGAAALNDTDRRHLRLAAEISADTCDLLHPVGAPRVQSSRPLANADEILAHVKTALATSGIEAALVDLTRAEFGIPVVRAVAPDLQLLPCDLTTVRLRRAIAASGGGHRWTGGVPLL